MNRFRCHKVHVRRAASLSLAIVALTLIVTPSAQADFGFLTKWGRETGYAFKGLKAIAVDPSGQYVYASDNRTVHKFLGDGTAVTSWRHASATPGDGEYLPSGVAVDLSRRFIYTAAQRLEKFRASGALVRRLSSGTSREKLTWGSGIAVAPSGKYLYATNVGGTYYMGDQITKLDPRGRIVGKWGKKGPKNARLHAATAIAVDRAGNVYVVDSQTIDKGGPAKVKKFSPGGKLIMQFGRGGSGDGEFHSVFGIAVDRTGNIYVADGGNNRIQKFDSKGRFVTKWGSEGSGDGEFRFPEGVAVDQAGNVYVADAGNARVQKFGVG